MSPQHSNRSRRRKSPSGARFYVILMTVMVMFICGMAVLDGVIHGGN